MEQIKEEKTCECCVSYLLCKKIKDINNPPPLCDMFEDNFPEDDEDEDGTEESVTEEDVPEVEEDAPADEEKEEKPATRTRRRR